VVLRVLLAPHMAVGPQALPGARERLDQVALVVRDQRRDARRFCGDEGARELAFGEHRLGRDQDQHLVQIGGE